MDQERVLSFLWARRTELADDPDNDGDNDSPGQGGDTDHDTIPASPQGVGLFIVGHLTQAGHHVRRMKRASEHADSSTAHHHEMAAQHHIARAMAGAQTLGGY